TAEGVPVTTTVAMTFRIYDSDDGGIVLWTEPRSVDPDADGLIHVVLGTVVPIPDTAFAGPESWLSVQVESDPELLPMIRLTSSPYSFRVGSVDGATGGAVTGALSLNYTPPTNKDATMADDDAILLDPDDARGPLLGVRDPGGGYTLLMGGTTEYYDDVLSHKDVNVLSKKVEVGLAGLIIFGSDDTDTIVHIDATGKARIGWGNSNTGSGAFALGSCNSATGDSSTVTGGNSNFAAEFYATIGGGLDNEAWGGAVVSGGEGNIAGGTYSVVGGGLGNDAQQSSSTIGGGGSNEIVGPLSGGTIAGGTSNEVTGSGGAIGGGNYNKADDTSSVVSGGRGNRARGKYSVVGGGGCDWPLDRDTNSALGHWSVIDGGRGNIARGDFSVIGGGHNNRVSDTCSVASGGRNNYVRGTFSTIGGGIDNETADSLATIGGGRSNGVEEFYGTVAGGRENWVTAPYGTVSGGYINQANGWYATVAGGRYNHADSSWSAVIGGDGNQTRGRNSAIVGGLYNETGGARATVVGGSESYSGGFCSFVGGGRLQHATGEGAAIIGGENDTATGAFSVVLGGELNVASGMSSIAGGYRAKARHDACFVFADGNEADFESVRQHQFRVRADGGADFTDDTTWFFSIYHDDVDLVTTSTGAHLTVGGSWANSSNRDLKENFREVDPDELLARLDSLPITEWNYRAESPDTRHLGPVAQDFYRLFGLGADDGSITTVDPVGVALAAIQELHRRNESLERQIAELRALIEQSQATSPGAGR
ncbi:MAG TPA: tail fiber domain-containing protein, partial [Acidobacteriota bacterium]|nr:tail fiber domain-containing protein [Acidobacteriota bacterium]